MKKFIILIFSMLAATVFAQDISEIGGHYSNGFVWSHYSYIDDKQLTFGLNDKAANDQSVWKTTETNPPVSVRDAIASARRMLHEVFSDKRVWNLESVTLKPVVSTLEAEDGIELWDYVITFKRNSGPLNPNSNGDGRVSFIVLMDGTAVRPTITAQK
jgi:hypothetical protein